MFANEQASCKCWRTHGDKWEAADDVLRDPS